MSTYTPTLPLVKRLIALISEHPKEEIQPNQRLYEDLQMDSLQITELAEKLENETGKSIDEDLPAAGGVTVGHCVEITDAAA
ncbi:acyl carrier protein [Streptomyces cellulosae]